MKIGMMWMDASSDDLKVKIERAAGYYWKKYGQVPNLCFVHPSMLPNPVPPGLIELRSNRSILPNHFWVGVREN